ncbi:MAG: response regulator [Draconibacterium sp.]|nr:response regulator [Draconibacterium sp.]
MLEVAPHVNIIGKSTTLTEAVQLIRKLKPNVILLDIQFEMEGKTAFDMLSELEATNDLNFQIIFITAHQEARYYALAFQFKALHFVEKPIDSEKLKEAFQRVNINIEAGFDPIVAKFGEIHKKMHTVGPNDRIVVEGNLYSELICVDEISTIEASGRYSSYALQMVGKLFPVKI